MAKKKPEKNKPREEKAKKQPAKPPKELTDKQLEQVAGGMNKTPDVTLKRGITR